MATTQRRTQDERRAETRRALVGATVDCLLEHGYRGASLARIAQKAGLTTGAVQHHFRTRQELMLAAMEEELFAPMYDMDPAAQAGNSTTDRCRFAVENIWHWYGDPRYPAVWDIILAARYDDELMASIQAWRVRSTKEFDEAFVLLFPERRFSSEWLKNLQHFMTCHLRGMAMMMIYEEHLLDVDEQLSLITEALRQMVDAAPRK